MAVLFTMLLFSGGLEQSAPAPRADARAEDQVRDEKTDDDRPRRRREARDDDAAGAGCVTGGMIAVVAVVAVAAVAAVVVAVVAVFGVAGLVVLTTGAFEEAVCGPLCASACSLLGIPGLLAGVCDNVVSGVCGAFTAPLDAATGACASAACAGTVAPTAPGGWAGATLAVPQAAAGPMRF